MNANRPAVQLVRWLVVALLVALGLWLLNGAVFNAWAAGGPPNPHPEYNLRWANRFLVASLLSFVGAAAVLWLMRRRKLAA